MSDYVFCLSDPEHPGRIEIVTSKNDPRMQKTDGFEMIRARHWPELEWTLPVVDRAMTMKALRKALRRARIKDDFYACDAMDARGEAIALTTVRPAPPRPGLLARLGLRGKAA